MSIPKGFRIVRDSYAQSHFRIQEQVGGGYWIEWPGLFASPTTALREINTELSLCARK